MPKKQGRIILTSNTSNVAENLRTELSLSSCRVAFIGTASEVEENPEWIKPDREALVKLGWEVFDYSITDKSQADLERDLSGCDVLYVVGGNVFYLLKKSQESGFLEVVQSHLGKGGTYIGHSAGAIIAGPDVRPAWRSDMVQHAETLEDYSGFNIVNFVVLPHWGSERLRSVYFPERLERVYSEEHIFQPLTDYQYANVVGESLRIVDMKT